MVDSPSITMTVVVPVLEVNDDDATADARRAGEVGVGMYHTLVVVVVFSWI